MLTSNGTGHGDDDGPGPRDPAEVEAENVYLRRLVATLKHLVGGVIVAFVIVGGATVYGFARQAALDARQEAADHREELQATEAAAETCINQHERVSDLRRLITQGDGGAAFAAVEAVAIVAGRLFEPGSLPPDLADQLATEADAQASRNSADLLEQYPDPLCDLDEARQTLVDVRDELASDTEDRVRDELGG